MVNLWLRNNLRGLLHMLITLILLAVPTTFLASFERELHCTQKTSFAIAVFELERHIEEKPIPLIYHSWVGLLLRGGLTFALLLYLFAPCCFFCYQYYQKLDFNAAALGLVTFLILALTIALMPQAIIGERFQALYKYSIPAGYSCYVLTLLAAKIASRAKVDNRLTWFRWFN